MTKVRGIQSTQTSGCFQPGRKPMMPLQFSRPMNPTGICVGAMIFLGPVKRFIFNISFQIRNKNEYTRPGLDLSLCQHSYEIYFSLSFMGKESHKTESV